MTLTPRLYRGLEDFRQLDAVLESGGQPQLCPYHIHPGELRWWLYYTFPDEDHFQRLLLWEDDAGRAAAWTLILVSEGSFDIFCRPEVYQGPELKHLLAWSVERAAELLRADGQDRLYKWWNHPEDYLLGSALQEMGFALSEDQTVAFTRALDLPLPPAALPPGFTLRSCRGLDELENRAAAQHSAFESEIPMEEYLQRFRSYMSSPAYHAEEDIVIEAPDGTLAAFARIWTNPVTRMGQFEPLGVRLDYQRRGLGRAIMAEGFRRMQAGGMSLARVCTGAANEPAVRLYEAVGFQAAARLQAYVRAV